MRTGILILLNLILATLAARADEVLPSLKVGPDVYQNVTITSVTATDVYFTSSKGMGNVKLKNLDPEMQQHFKFDFARADAAEKKLKLASPPFSLSAPPADLVAGYAINHTNAQAVMDNAISRVKIIVNQPVKSYPETPDLRDHIGYYPDGWFHPGANKPEYVDVDIHATQDLQYAKNPYVTSSLNPGVVFVGTDVEFNANTKFFYLDRSLPKKKLTDAEMVEINRLYRIIASCEDALSRPANAGSLVSSVPQLARLYKLSGLSPSFLALHRNMIIAVAVSAVVLLVCLRSLTKKSAH